MPVMEMRAVRHLTLCCSTKKCPSVLFTHARHVDRKSKIILFGQFPMSLGSGLHDLYCFNEYKSSMVI